MSLLLALLAASAPAAASADEIVVIARRLDGVSVTVGQDPQGRWHCGMDGSSGVPRLDDQLCRAVTKCVRKGAREEAAVQGCVKSSKSALLAKFKREAERNR